MRILTMRVSERQRELLKKCAEEDGLTVSEWIEKACKEKVETQNRAWKT